MHTNCLKMKTKRKNDDAIKYTQLEKTQCTANNGNNNYSKWKSHDKNVFFAHCWLSTAWQTKRHDETSLEIGSETSRENSIKSHLLYSFPNNPRNRTTNDSSFKLTVPFPDAPFFQLFSSILLVWYSDFIIMHEIIYSFIRKLKKPLKVIVATMETIFKKAYVRPTNSFSELLYWQSCCFFSLEHKKGRIMP